MANPPIPQRIPPLTWRKPAWLWSPLALALALGAAYALFYQDGSVARAVLAAGALTFALALATLSAGWALGHPPRTHRIVVLHVLAAAVIVALAAPWGFSALQAKGAGADLALALAPLAALLGLPLALISGLIFSLTALTRPRPEKPLELTEDDARYAHQPFN